MTWKEEDKELFRRLGGLPDFSMSPGIREKMLRQLLCVEREMIQKGSFKVSPRRSFRLISVGVLGVLIAGSGVGYLIRDSQSKTRSEGSAVNTEQSTEYSTYVNRRFGFVVLHPTTWSVSSAAMDGDGRVFATPSAVSSFDNGAGPDIARSDVILEAVGVVNATMGMGQGYDFAQMLASFQKNLPNERSQPGVISENYTIVPGHWIVDTVVKKVGRDGIEYSKTYMNLNTNQSVRMTFPVGESSTYLPVWDHVATTFVPGNGMG